VKGLKVKGLKVKGLDMFGLPLASRAAMRCDAFTPAKMRQERSPYRDGHHAPGTRCDLGHVSLIHRKSFAKRGRVGKALRLSLHEWPGAKAAYPVQFFQSGK